MVFSNKKREIHYKNVFCIFLYKESVRDDVDLIVWLFLWRLAKKVKLIQMMYTIDHVFLMSLFMMFFLSFLYFMRETPVSTWPSDSQSYSNLLFPYSNISLLDMSDLCLSDAYSALQSNIHFKMIRLMFFNIHDNS